MSNIQNVSGARTIVQVEGRIVPQNASEGQKPIRTLDTGERISGKIISMSDDSGSRNVQVRLGDNSVINARLNEGTSLKEGQYVSFEVRGVSRNQITLTPLYENTSIDPTALKALTAAGLNANQENLTMVRSMMENGMPIDKGSLNSMHQIISDNQGTDVSSLVQMKSLGIPISDQNIQQFESYKNYEHQVVETMDSIMDDLPEAFNELVQNGDTKSANNLYGDILKMISDGYTQMETSAGAPSEALQNADANTQSGIIGKEVLLNEATAEGSSYETVFTEAEGVPKDVSSDTRIPDTAKASSQNQPQNVIGEALAEADDTLPQTIAAAPKNMITVSNNFAALVKELSQQTGASGTEISKLLEQASTGKSTDIDRSELMKELAGSYTESADSSDDAAKAFMKLFQNSEYNKIMKASMKDQWLIEPKDVSNKENVENLYSRLNAQARQLTESLIHNLGAESRVAQSASNLQSNIDFMNQLNQMFHYVQLPLKMADQDAHGDLYVYSNGKRKFEPGETVSAILHLDMDNLGPLDVYVKMKDSNVKTNFYVADEETIDLIAEHIDILNERLSKRGYNMEAKMMLHTDMDDDSEDAAVSEMLSVKKMPVISMQSFDARA